MRKQKPDPHETLRRALKAEYRIGPEWSPWKFQVPIRATSEELEAALDRILTKAGAVSRTTNDALAAVWDAGATAGANFQWEYDRTHSTDALRHLDNPYRRQP